MTFVKSIITCAEVALVAYPIISSVLGWSNNLAQFVLAIIGMLPLAKKVGDLVEDLCEHYCSRSVASFFAATLGNFPELIFGIVAVYNGQMHLMSAAMFGSPMSNILLVFGTSIIAGTFFKGKDFRCFKDKTIHCVGANMTMMSAISYAFLVIVTQLNSNGVTQNERIGLSEVIAVCNLALYGLFTAKKFFPKNDVVLSIDIENQSFLTMTNSYSSINSITSTATTEPATNGVANSKIDDDIDSENSDNNNTAPSLFYIIAMMSIVTVCITLLSDIISNKVDVVLKGSPISKTFVGIIVLPFICNAAEHVSAIYQMLSDDEDAADGAMEVAAGSAYQILGFVVPVINFLSFGAKNKFTFDIDPLILITLNITTFILVIVVSNNRLDLFEGIGMVMIWIMIGGAFYVYDAVLA